MNKQEHKQYEDKIAGAIGVCRDIAAERDALLRKLDAVMAMPEPEPPCPCKPRRWKDCECGAYRKGGFHTNEIDAYAEAMEVLDAVRAIVEAEHGRD